MALVNKAVFLCAVLESPRVMIFVFTSFAKEKD